MDLCHYSCVVQFAKSFPTEHFPEVELIVSSFCLDKEQEIMFRLDAVVMHHRILRLVTGDKAYGPDHVRNIDCPCEEVEHP